MEKRPCLAVSVSELPGWGSLLVYILAENPPKYKRIRHPSAVVVGGLRTLGASPHYKMTGGSSYLNKYFRRNGDYATRKQGNRRSG